MSEEKYYHTKASVEEYIRLAKDVSGAQLIRKLEGVLAATSELLEIGSGPGTDWALLNRTYQVTGSDNSDEFINHLNSKFPGEEFISLDAGTLLTNKNFDGIYSNKVLHHLHDHELVDSIRRQYEILRPEGVVCHSFWKGKGSEVYNGLYVNYQNKESLVAAFKSYFKVLSVESYKEFEEDDSLLFLGRKVSQ